MNPLRTVLAFVLLTAARAAAEDAARHPYVTFDRTKDGGISGFAQGTGITLVTSLGTHELKWADISNVAYWTMSVEVLLTDGSRLRGTLKETTVKIRTDEGKEVEVDLKNLRSFSVDLRALPPPPPPQAPELPVLGTSEVFDCSGVVDLPGGVLVVADPVQAAAIFYDPRTLSPISVTKLPKPPTCIRRVFGSNMLVAGMNGLVAWIDTNTGKVVRDIAVEGEVTSLAAPTEDLVLAAAGKTTVLVFRKAGKVIGRDDLESVVWSSPWKNCAITTRSLYWLDQEANGKPHLPISRACGGSFGASDFPILSPDSRFVVTGGGIVTRLGRGMDTGGIEVARTIDNRCGFFHSSGKFLVLLDRKQNIVTFETEKWTEVSRARTGCQAWAAIPADDGKTAVLVTSAKEPPLEDSCYRYFLAKVPSRFVRISLEKK